MKTDFYVPAFPFPGGKVRQAQIICSFAPSTGHIFADVICGLGNAFLAITITAQVSGEGV
jgi:hypothetical protein